MLLTCPHCSFQHPFEWAMNAHIHEKHANMTARAKIPFPSTILSVGPDGGGRAPTTVSVPPIRSGDVQRGLGVEDSESEHGDTDEESVDDIDVHEETENDDEMDADNGEADNAEGDDDNDDEESDDEESDDDIFNSDDEDDDEFHLLDLILDIESTHKYCIAMRREYRKALKQLNDLGESDKQKVIESYAKLEVSIMDEQFGIENENNNEKDDLWDFVFEFRDMLEEDTK